MRAAGDADVIEQCAARLEEVFLSAALLTRSSRPEDLVDLTDLLGVSTRMLAHLRSVALDQSRHPDHDDRDPSDTCSCRTCELQRGASTPPPPQSPPLTLVPMPVAPPTVAVVAQAPAQTWEDLTDAFRTHLLAAGRTDGTIRVRLGHVRQFSRDYPDATAVGPEAIEAFLAARRSTHKAETRASLRASLRTFFAWLADRDYIDRDPAARLPPVRKAATVPRVAHDDDIHRALAEASPRDRAIILLARFGCLRRNEIATLKVADRHGGVLHVLGKGEKQRRVPLNPQLLEALTALEQDGRVYYFPGETNGHLNGETVHHTITRLTGWNPHSLRHAGATAAYRATRDLRAVQELLGHASADMTQRYVHVDEDALRAVADATATGYEP